MDASVLGRNNALAFSPTSVVECLFGGVGEFSMGVLDWVFGRGRSGPDGSSPGKAVPVDGIGEEFAWMQQHYPGFRPGTQALQEMDGNPFDVLTWRNDRGEQRTVYFDISAFYGKRRSAAGPQCPYCGIQLRTDKAKQCFECGTDWRDPANVVCRAKRADNQGS